MASMSTTKPSSSSSTSRWKYEVFVSFYGQDTDTTFTDDLYAAFKRNGILTYRDDNELPRGNCFSEELLKAVQESMFAVVVISPNYAFSKWCLIELTEIMECMRKTGLTVWSIFYYVDPSSVRNQKDSFAKAFAKHECDPQVDMKTIQQWKATLKDVGNTAGWIIDGVRNEPAIIRDIVAHILSLRRLHSRLNIRDLSVPEKLVAIDSLEKQAMNLLGDELDDVRFIGICGMSGIGKTTLAKFVYDRVSSQFEASSFIYAVSDQAAWYGLHSVQNQLIYEITMAKEINIGNVHEGISVMRDIMRNRKVLIVLDGVDAERQLDALAGSHDWFGRGSKIIVTSTHRDLLRRHMDYIHETKLLNHEEALKLFSWAASRELHLDEDYMDLAKDFVIYAERLPFALIVWGRFLYGRTIYDWQEYLDAIKVNLNTNIMRVLEMSFNRLNDLQKKLFLDIACFFQGKVLDEELIEILESCDYDPHINIELLRDKCLLRISPLGELQMHNLLRAMGQEIVRHQSSEEDILHGFTNLGELQMHNLLRAMGQEIVQHQSSEEDILNMFTNNTGTDAVEGIVQQLPIASTVLGSSLLSDRMVEGIVQQLPLAGTVLGPSLFYRRAEAWKSLLDILKANLGTRIFWNGWYQYNTSGENFQRNVEAIDLSVGIMAFVLELALIWLTNSKPFERAVLVVSWINSLTAWTLFFWEARSRRAHFALPRWRLPNRQPYGGTIDYVDKYTAIVLVMFSTVCMIFNISGQKFSYTGLVLSAVILGAKLHIEYQRRHSR